ncbi:MAG: ABC transporter ATP-binding protein [Pedococcus sp.]
MSAPALQLTGLEVAYGPVVALAAVDLQVSPGEVIALLGSSGSGKTTLLHAVAGLVEPTSGQISIGERVVAGAGRWTAPEDRRVGLVFQGAALWPHINVLDTVAYPIQRGGATKANARCEAAALLERLGLAALTERFPAQLSGGEQQRVGLARALARNPDLFLFDEPTAHLDTHLRGLVLEEIARRREALGAAALYATHNAAEALAIADRVAVLRGGRLVQIGTPQEVYEQPVDVDTARLTGPASVVHTNILCERGNNESSGRVLVRPDWVRLGGDLPGRVDSVRYRGPHTDLVISVAGGQLLVSCPGPPRRRVGEQVGLTVTQTWPITSGASVRNSVAPRRMADTDA